MIVAAGQVLACCGVRAWYKPPNKRFERTVMRQRGDAASVFLLCARVALSSGGARPLNRTLALRKQNGRMANV